MKNIIIIIVLCFTIFSCNTKKNEKKPILTKVLVNNYESFGNLITDVNSLTYDEVMSTYNTIKIGDTINLKFSSNISEVCTKKGCWMNLSDNDLGEKVMVRFKDYGFFMPLNVAGKEVIVQGKAFVDEVSVSDLKHYAEDAGKSVKQIAEITKPKLKFSFEANGVLMKK
tara:strand:- start:8012 stop:8518 length:507 start_codon:yes stop_codon:yes gene_type:complete